MSRSRPSHSQSPHRIRSTPHQMECPPRPESKREPTAVDLAEALLGTTHAFKQWGNLCFSQAEPGLRELSVPRARLLAAVVDTGPGRVRMGDLSAALGVTARNITTIVDGLEREGLLARKPDPTDRRAILLELTEKGRAHVEQVHALQRDLAEHMFAPLSPEERRTLYALLTRLARWVAQAGQTGAHGREAEPADRRV
jgi:DNA-binding MarR family transcriptional regulator